MKQILKYIWIEFIELVAIHFDKTSIMSMSKNLVLHSKTKHISIKYLFERESCRKRNHIGVC